MSEEEEIKIGEEIARVLKLQRHPDHYDRWLTTHGGKTSLGLVRTVRGLLEAPAEKLAK